MATEGVLGNSGGQFTWGNIKECCYKKDNCVVLTTRVKEASYTGLQVLFTPIQVEVTNYHSAIIKLLQIPTIVKLLSVIFLRFFKNKSAVFFSSDLSFVNSLIAEIVKDGFRCYFLEAVPLFYTLLKAVCH